MVLIVIFMILDSESMDFSDLSPKVFSKCVFLQSVKLSVSDYCNASNEVLPANIKKKIAMDSNIANSSRFQLKLWQDSPKGEIQV